MAEKGGGGDPFDLKRLAVHVTIIVGVFTLIGFLGDRFFLTRGEGEKMAAKLAEIATVVSEIQAEQKKRSSIFLQHDDAIERIVLTLDSLEKRMPR